MKTVNELKNAIKKVEAKAASDLAKLNAELSLVNSPFSIKDTLYSTLSKNLTFTVTGSDDRGLTGILSDTNGVIRPEDSKHWRLQGKSKT